MKHARLAVVLALLLMTVALLALRPEHDRVPPSESLDRFPASIAGWSSTNITLDPEVLAVLGDGRFLNRVYRPEDAGARAVTAPVSLFLGYFPTQRTGQAIHSPLNCLPGAGWTFESKGRTLLRDGRGGSYAVGEYLVTDGSTRQDVLYWYRSQGRNVASEYAAKAYLIEDAIRRGRTDGALIRLSTPVLPNEDLQAAHRRLTGFAEQMVRDLTPFVPS